MMIAQQEKRLLGALPTELSKGPFEVHVQNLVKRFRRDSVLQGLNMQVPEGGAYVLVGPNGAGKSTTFKILMDLLRPNEGSAKVFGLDTARDGARVRTRIGYVPERFEWGYPWMRVGQLLEHHSSYFESWDSEYAAALVRAFDLRLERKIGSLSKGQGRRVHLVMAMAHRPRLLLLDEPTDGLDPVMLDETLGLVSDHIAATPTTVVISTHQVHDLDRLVDHVGLMRDGRMILQAPRDVLREQLLEYHVDIPELWQAKPALEGAVLRRERLGREIRWCVWGAEAELVARFTQSGATVRRVTPLTLAEASLVLLRSENQT